MELVTLLIIGALPFLITCEHANDTMRLTFEEVASHHEKGDFWVIINEYVLDLSDFLPQHPGLSARIVQKRKELGPDISPSFLDHFGHTVRTFQDACNKFEQAKTPLSFYFKQRPGIAVKIIGKVATDPSPQPIESERIGINKKLQSENHGSTGVFSTSLPLLGLLLVAAVSVSAGCYKVGPFARRVRLDQNSFLGSSTSGTEAERELL